jgi:hypothetical protein
MRIQGVFAVSGVVALIGAGALSGCSSSSAAQDPGLSTGGSGDIKGHDTNPYGVAYPATNIGTKPSSSDPSKDVVGKPGNTMANFKFYGYPGGDMSKGTQEVSLADYYDPQHKTYKLIHVQAAGTWCVWCQRETQATVPIYEKLKGEGVVWLTAVVEGSSPGSAASQKDLDHWVTTYKPTFTNVVDPNNHNLGIFFSAGGLPWNANIDPATMEILSAGEGAPSSDGSSVTGMDVENEVEPWIAFLAKHPADPTTGLRK